MAWDAVIATIRCSNLSDFSSYVDVTIDALIAEPYDLQDEAGEREPGAGAVMLQNIATRGHVDLVVRRIRIDQGEWDYGDYQKVIRSFRRKFLRLQSVTGASAAIHSGTNTGGTDAPYWANTAALPRNVIAKYDKPDFERRKGQAARMNWAVQLISTTPTVGDS